MRLYLVRHADPDYPNNTITPAGHLEAQALSRRLASHGLDRIYMSPLGRAQHTAKYTADALGMTPQVEDWTTELSECRVNTPPISNLCMWDVHGELIRGGGRMPTHHDWHELEHLSDPAFRSRIAMLQRNSDEFLSRHGYERAGGRYRTVRPHKERIAVFCHGGFGLCWLSHLLEIPLSLVFAGFFLPPSSVTTILFDERSRDWAVPRCIGLGDVSHLYEAGLPTQPAGIKANFW